MPEINYQLVERKEKVQLPENLEFGRIFTDHMFEMDYDENKGWHNARIKKFENLSFHPATLVFHYGQTIFEGLKAYKNNKGDIRLFRPEKNFERLNNSAKRMCMPQVDVDFCLEALAELIRIDKEWIPTTKGNSLYIRPLMMGVDPFLGVKPSKTYKLYILLTPVGAYYKEGFKPVKILSQDTYVRAVRKGLGECKTAANYAASLQGAYEAQQKGFTQVLWLDAVEQKYIEEVGTMNIFVRFKNEVATPKLTGGILPGITRMSVIQMLKDWGMNVNERLISISEIMDEYKKGNVLEMFGSGTAAVISSLGSLTYKDCEMKFSKDGEPGELALKLFNEITAVQYGEKRDKFNWVKFIND
jgi:branched-chain amino acid aminotransferase